jgi:hypothetical protein
MNHNPNQNQKRPNVVLLPPPEAVTEQQVHTALDVLLGLQAWMIPDKPTPGEFSAGLPSDFRLDGEAAIAASTTFIKACARIDALLDDGTRWGMDVHKKLQENLEKNYAQQYEFLKAQTEASQALARPFFLMKPEFVQCPDGTFVAYVGDLSIPGSGIMGVGITPQAASEDFDRAYTRYAAEQLRLQSVTPTPPTKKSPKKKT